MSPCLLTSVTGQSHIARQGLILLSSTKSSSKDTSASGFSSRIPSIIPVDCLGTGMGTTSPSRLCGPKAYIRARGLVADVQPCGSSVHGNAAIGKATGQPRTSFTGRASYPVVHHRVIGGHSFKAGVLNTVHLSSILLPGPARDPGCARKDGETPNIIRLHLFSDTGPEWWRRSHYGMSISHSGKHSKQINWISLHHCHVINSSDC